MIEITQLEKSYGNHRVLKHIDATFHSGNVYGIVGENGAGKTTLFRCIAGLESYEGSIKSSHQLLKDHIGLLLTEPFFFTRITGREYVRLLCKARNIEVKDMDRQNIFDLPLDQYASTFSTGMKKKLALFAILLQKNDIIILDEPFNGVDIQSNIVITALIKQLKSLNKTVLISSHIFSTLRDTCDEILLLREGEFVQSAGKEAFDDIESAMTISAIGNRIQVLDLD